MRIKYPRTFHLPWSLGATSDDKTHSPAAIVEMFGGREVVVTEKMDGENTSIYSDGYTHARSLDSAHHSSRARLKALAAAMAHNIPEGWRVCGENVYAEHSVGYDRLTSHFYVFAIFDQYGSMLGWDEMVEWSQLLGLEVVPLLFRGVYDEKSIRETWVGQSAFGDEGEGYVIRLADAIGAEEFRRCVAKFVRENHVQTDTHWMHSTIVPNGLV